MLRKLWAAAVALSFVAACGAPGHPGQASTTQPTPPTEALAAWKDFPIDANPRPILWLDGPTGVTAAPNNDAKVAALCDKLVLRRGLQLPTATPAQATATWPSGTAVAYRAISASTAFSILLRSGTLASSMCDPVKPLLITSVRWATASITTDRGPAKLSVWLFKAAGVTGEFAYPGLDSSAYWHGAQLPAPGELGIGGTVGADGTTLTIGVMGENCDTGYSTAVAESANAVAVAVMAIKSATEFCDHVGRPRSTTVHLMAPLGGRVLVDENGNAGEICPQAGC